jgi:pimeloyl-ACP methyl ester carboxylesterase
VALEAAFVAPELFGGVVCVAPYLPWRSHTWALSYARLLNPEFAEKIPLERVWPALKWIAERIESHEDLEHDWLARASVRVIYYWSCASTRSAFVSAARELALDPSTGRGGTWTRLRKLAVPASFLWCGRDALIPAAHAGYVQRALPSAHQLELACSGHFVHGAHYRCFNRAVASAVGRVLDAPEGRAKRKRKAIDCPCIADLDERAEGAAAEASGLAGSTS